MKKFIKLIFLLVAFMIILSSCDTREYGYIGWATVVKKEQWHEHKHTEYRVYLNYDNGQRWVNIWDMLGTREGDRIYLKVKYGDGWRFSHVEWKFQKF